MKEHLKFLKALKKMNVKSFKNDGFEVIFTEDQDKQESFIAPEEDNSFKLETGLPDYVGQIMGDDYVSK